MKQVTVSVFRLTITEVSEPVEITNNGKVIGEYNPRLGVQPVEGPVAIAKPLRPVPMRRTPDLTRRA